MDAREHSPEASSESWSHLKVFYRGAIACHIAGVRIDIAVKAYRTGLWCVAFVGSRVCLGDVDDFRDSRIVAEANVDSHLRNDYWRSDHVDILRDNWSLSGSLS